MTLHFRCLILSAAVSVTSAFSATSPFSGRWALTLPDHRPGWLGVEEQPSGELAVSLLWGDGSVTPVKQVEVVGDELRLTRTFKLKGERVTRIITAKRQGDALHLITFSQTADETAGAPQSFQGTRITDLPPAPDLSKVKFGPGIPLLAKADLSDWNLVPAKQANGWSIQDGVLMNRVDKSTGKRFGNLRTKAEFEDFRLTTDVRTLPDSNSGIYLRGRYEVQIEESYGKPADSHHLGALYSRITPKVAAEKPIGEWQTLDITLVDRHLTVILNGTTIIDNEPVLGCTGGAMTSDETGPGPILLQGDHSNIDYRNMVLHPVVN